MSSVTTTKERKHEEERTGFSRRWVERRWVKRRDRPGGGGGGGVAPRGCFDLDRRGGPKPPGPLDPPRSSTLTSRTRGRLFLGFWGFGREGAVVVAGAGAEGWVTPAELSSGKTSLTSCRACAARVARACALRFLFGSVGGGQPPTAGAMFIMKKKSRVVDRAKTCVWFAPASQTSFQMRACVLCCCRDRSDLMFDRSISLPKQKLQM